MAEASASSINMLWSVQGQQAAGMSVSASTRAAMATRSSGGTGFNVHHRASPPVDLTPVVGLG
jgi:hypothetical protein